MTYSGRHSATKKSFGQSPGFPKLAGSFGVCLNTDQPAGFGFGLAKAAAAASDPVVAAGHGIPGWPLIAWRRWEAIRLWGHLRPNTPPPWPPPIAWRRCPIRITATDVSSALASLGRDPCRAGHRGFEDARRVAHPRHQVVTAFTGEPGQSRLTLLAQVTRRFSSQFQSASLMLAYARCCLRRRILSVHGAGLYRPGSWLHAAMDKVSCRVATNCPLTNGRVAQHVTGTCRP